MSIKYFKKLTNAANRKNKNELQVYKEVSECIDNILQEDEENDKCLILRALIAYFEGKSVYSWFISIISIAYTLIMGVITIICSMKAFSNEDLRGLAYGMLILAVIIVIVATCNFDFEKKFIICVLNDKLIEYAKIHEKEGIEGNDVMVEIVNIDYEDVDIKKNRKNKKNKHHKKKTNKRS